MARRHDLHYSIVSRGCTGSRLAQDKLGFVHDVIDHMRHLESLNWVGNRGVKIWQDQRPSVHLETGCSSITFIVLIGYSKSARRPVAAS